MTQVLICCGAGGVGKTTLSAGLAVRLARADLRVAVLTIDPARRLADSLGLDATGAGKHRLALPGGARSIDAMMLDAKATFDWVVRSLAPSEEAADRILRNRYYRYVSTRLAGSQEYMALVRLQGLVESGDYDVIVLDTPPTRHALDFLTAPDRVAAVMDQRVLQRLALPQTSAGMRSLYQSAAKVIETLDRFLGVRTIRELAEFVASFEGMTEGFRERAETLRAYLRSERTSFVLVTTPAPSRHAEARAFHRFIQEHEFRLWGVLVNRRTPVPRTDLAPARDDLPPEPPSGVDRRTWEDLCRGVLTAPQLFRRLAEVDQVNLRQLRAGLDPDITLWGIPTLDEEIHDLHGLVKLGERLPGPDALGLPPAAT